MSAVVIAKCIGCGETREIRAGEIAPGDHPMCDLCGMPIVAWKGKVVRDPDGDEWEEKKIRERETLEGRHPQEKGEI